MPSDPLARSDIWTGAPNEAEYDAVYAAVTATERGRWFLTEYANRNRHADTGALIDAIARVEEALRSGRTGHAAAPVPDLSAAAERIQDIAFMLRERAADAALCDALETAAREIGAACARGNAGPLSAAAAPTNGSQPAAVSRYGATATSDGDPLSICGLFTMDLSEREKFTEAIAALAQPVSSSADTVGTSSTAHDETAREIPSSDNQPAYEPVSGTPTDARPRWYIEPPDFAFHTAARDANQPPAALTSEDGQAHSLLPQAQLLPGPQDDPADLFEQPAAASAGAAPPVRAVPRPAPPDPLAAIRALSEEEVIALFS